jgi:hypothetical protein
MFLSLRWVRFVGSNLQLQSLPWALACRVADIVDCHGAIFDAVKDNVGKPQDRRGAYSWHLGFGRGKGKAIEAGYDGLHRVEYLRRTDRTPFSDIGCNAVKVSERFARVSNGHVR